MLLYVEPSKCDQIGTARSEGHLTENLPEKPRKEKLTESRNLISIKDSLQGTETMQTESREPTNTYLPKMCLVSSMGDAPGENQSPFLTM